MNRHTLCPLLLLLHSAVAADPPRFVLTSHTLDGGGWSMADGCGRFRLTGTIGQPDAAPALGSADARYTLQPGFWNASTIFEAPDAPPLRFLPVPAGSTFTLLAWPVSSSGWILESSTDLAPGSWTARAEPVVDTLTDHSVSIQPGTQRLFFRLRRQ